MARYGSWIAAFADAPLHDPMVPWLPLYTQWPRIKLIAFGKYRQVIRRCCCSQCCKKYLATDSVILGAFGRVFKKFWHAAYLGPEYVRVTTALRCVVTRTIVRSNQCARRLPVTQVALFVPDNALIFTPEAPLPLTTFSWFLKSVVIYWVNRFFALSLIAVRRWMSTRREKT